jgi:hypothetical protein
MPSVGVLYFGLFNPFQYSPLPLYLPCPVFEQFSIHVLIFSAFTSYVKKRMQANTIFLLSSTEMEMSRLEQRHLCEANNKHLSHWEWGTWEALKRI